MMYVFFWGAFTVAVFAVCGCIYTFVRKDGKGFPRSRR